jgi:hypothetical protein
MSARGARPGKPAYNFNFVKKAKKTDREPTLTQAL